MDTLQDDSKQSISLWERLSLFSRVQSKEEQRERRRWRAVYSLYSLTPGQWQAIFERQQGCCAICGTSQDDLGYILEIDYDHKTGKVRGLLCRKCNLGIGMFGEDVENINKAIRYLEKS
jgi:5-methylcytosine-specific restriction endonuclease McrA